MIRIVDYGMGNLRSVQKALELLGREATLTQDPGEIRSASRLILPGVGAFGAAMVNLERLGLVDAIRDFAASGKPFLGICLGMQLLLSESDEQGLYKGLDLVPGRVLKFFQPQDRIPTTTNLKVPHMGWNSIRKSDSLCQGAKQQNLPQPLLGKEGSITPHPDSLPQGERENFPPCQGGTEGGCPLLRNVPDGAAVYFVHSFYPAPPKDYVAATTDYGINFCSVIWKDNIFATQFHPEKSGAVGLRMLENFAAIGTGV